MKADYVREWEKMERRQAAERLRDEAMIERARGSGKRDQAGERMRKGFRIRAGKETAINAPTPLHRDIAMIAQRKAAAAKRSESDGGVARRRDEQANKAIERTERIRSRNRDRKRERSPDRER